MQKIFKKILVFLLCVVAIVICIPKQELSADLERSWAVGEIFWIHEDHQNILRVYATWDSQNSKWLWQNGHTDKILLSEDDEYPHHVLLYVYWTPSSLNLDYWEVLDYTQNLTPLNADQNSLYSQGYTNGYNVGVQESNINSYNAGYESGYNAGVNEDSQSSYDDGYRDGLAQFNPNTEAYNTIYQSGYRNGYSDGEDAVVGDTGFYTMLKMIAMYPIEIFTTGLDVDIFGINVGGFLLGCGMLAIVLFVLRRLLGR